MPNATTKTVAHGITFTGVLSMGGMATRPSTDMIPVPYISSNTTYSVQVYIDATNISINTGGNMVAYTSTLIAVEYYR